MKFKVRKIDFIVGLITVTGTCSLLPSISSNLTSSQFGEDRRNQVEGEAGLGSRQAEAQSTIPASEFAPEFALPDSQGQIVKLKQLLANGPVILSFYRGPWCPFCNRALQELQESLPAFKEHNAQLIAVSPQTPEHSTQTVKEARLSFTVLSDAKNQVAKSFGVVHKLPQSIQATYKAAGVDLANFNGDNSGELPLPATFVTNTRGKIIYRFVDSDFRRRAKPEEILEALVKSEAAEKAEIEL